MHEKSKNSQSKREQFLDKKKKKNIPVLIISALAIITIVLTGIYYFGDNDKVISSEYFGEPIVESRSFVGQFVDMQTISPEITDTQVKISLKEVDENNIVYFESENKNGQIVPIMVYVTPTGRVFAGSSMCEPCRGTKFSLAGETLVCNTCGTTYEIETHKFISGSPVCGSYPPVNMSPTILEDTIIIEKNEILDWEIRG